MREESTTAPSGIPECQCLPSSTEHAVEARSLTAIAGTNATLRPNFRRMYKCSRTILKMPPSESGWLPHMLG